MTDKDREMLAEIEKTMNLIAAGTNDPKAIEIVERVRLLQLPEKERKAILARLAKGTE